MPIFYYNVVYGSVVHTHLNASILLRYQMGHNDTRAKAFSNQTIRYQLVNLSLDLHGLLKIHPIYKLV